jgi:hypothetical protein
MRALIILRTAFGGAARPAFAGLAIAIGLLVGCGGDPVHHLADAPPQSDAPIDMMMIPSGPVTLTVTSQGQPAAGVKVYFQNPDGTVVSNTMTDATGVATAIVDIGASVTAIAPQPPPGTFGGAPIQNDTLATWAAVKPNDQLHWDLFATAVGFNTLAFNVIAPTDPTGGTVYTLFTNCGQSDITPPAVGSAFVAGAANPPVAVTITDCTNGKIDLIVTTSDLNTGQIISSFFLADVAIATGVDLDLTASTYAAATTSTFNYTNASANVGSISIDQSLVTARGVIYQQSTNTPVDTGTASATMTVPGAGTGLIAVTSSFLFPSSQAIASSQTIFDWGPYTAAYNVDLSTVALKEYTQTPMFDPVAHAITWPEDGGTASDVVVANYHTFRSDATLSHNWNWLLAAPRDTFAKVTYPTIPTDVFDYNTKPAPGDSFDVQQLRSAKVPGGYDAVRSQIMNGNLDGIAVGPQGHAVIEDMFFVKLRHKSASRTVVRGRRL